MGQSGYQYDANGNLLDDGKRSYQWDAADRLIEITDTQTGHTSQFAYDGLNRRISATETDQGGNPVTTKFLWCGERLCAKRDSNDTVLARYYDGGELRGNQPLYYAQDQVGSVVAVVNGQGQVVGRLSYDSYGNVIQQQGTLPDYRYAGLYTHTESGLYLATYRAYDPETARWLSRDPIRENGGVNLYGYVGGNPLSWMDSTGMQGIARLPIPMIPPGAGPNVWNGGAAGAGFGGIGIGVGIYELLKRGEATDNIYAAHEHPSGFWPGDKGAAEWGRRNGFGAREGKGRFHGIKQSCPGSNARDNYGVNPENGDVVDPEGDIVGNLNDVKSK